MPSALLETPRVLPAAPRPIAAAGPVAAPAERPRHLPLAVVAAATLAVLESLGLLAMGLTGLDGLFGTGVRPSGALVAVALLVLAGWVVLCAGGAATLLDGAGRGLLIAVASGEMVLLAVLALAGVVGVDGVRFLALGPLGLLPLPALALLGLGVPTGKLVLAGAPSAQAWVRAGGAPRTARSPRVAEHGALRTVTLVCIGLALTGVALVGGPAGGAGTPSTAAVVDAP